ncbi:MAG: hypothetical protein ACOX06_02100 [Candidatus Dojkabacteria bacterium]|jgi:hypothetical protein
MKKTLNILLFIILLFAFSPFAIFAQEEEEAEESEKIDKNIVYMESVELSDTLSENETKAENVERGSMKTIAGMSLSLFMSACPDCFEGELPEELEGRGLTNIVDGQIAKLFNNQPRVDLVAHLADEWVPGYKHVGDSVYAGGFGDLENTKIAGLWTKTRNIAYLGYVIIMIIVGFMIMFRNKIGGQVMVTVSNSIPRIVVSLILVTFSFGIIGLIIDFGGVVRSIIDSIYFGGESGIDVHNPFFLVGGFLGRNEGTAITSALGIAGIVIMIVKTFNPLGLLLSLMGLVVLCVVLWGAIKLWITLLKSYFGMLINIVTAPLAILFGSLPGNEASLFNVFKSALRNVLAFPLAYAIVNLPYVLEDQGVVLSFPETLVHASTDDTTFLPNLLIEIAKVMAIYAAAAAPEILKAIIPATGSKAGEEIGKALKENVSKTPLIGGLFKS